MPSAGHILNHRADPGILILNAHKKVLFANDVAWKILLLWRQGAKPPRGRGKATIPAEIIQCCDELKGRLDCLAWNGSSDALCLKRAVALGELFFALRTFVFSSRSVSSLQFLVLLERLMVRSKIDLERASTAFSLSKQETSLVRLLTSGLTNKEIAHHLSIAESTVKEYLGKIMAKVGASTRSGVVSKILLLSFDGTPAGEREGTVLTEQVQHT